MEVSLVKIEPHLRSVLENLFQYYVYDMSEFMEFTLNDEGQYAFDSSQFDVYWERDDHFPYLIIVGSELAGFALVRRYPSNTSIYDIEQFFVLRKFKGKGVGKKALELVLKSYPGKWQIRVLIENMFALNFWKSAVSNVVGCEYSLSEDIDVDLKMNFFRFKV
ncbi:GNAT family N-acetyltransferase [Photobacterium sanctipauli]|uniref:GNAT family N-acetyltransferase n=1 Tax=Photobacterium sanctipauli TaxID=1342794 RepID=A0A2T3NNK0_9GAMM|nr:GNAT family N-acetyltransferase [Photobacterium sanctipauli]PSW17562.1 GNAT family N-acetyltransferase [Photobacterium sanctipauli]